MKTKLTTVTPSRARKWLDNTNGDNRPLGMEWVRQLADRMSAGKWKVNGETIKFSQKGRLLDGQHRLMAIVLADVPVQTYVSTDAPDDVFDTIDQGKKRTGGDILALMGEKRSKALAASARLVYLYSLNGQAKRVRRSGIDNQMIRETVQDHPELRDAVELASKSSGKHITQTELAFCIYQTRKLWGADRVDQFWMSVATAENLKRGTPAHALYRKLYDNMHSQTKLSRNAKMAFCVKAFNTHIEGRGCKVLRLGESEGQLRFKTQRKAGHENATS